MQIKSKVWVPVDNLINSNFHENFSFVNALHEIKNVLWYNTRLAPTLTPDVSELPLNMSYKMLEGLVRKLQGPWRGIDFSWFKLEKEKSATRENAEWKIDSEIWWLNTSTQSGTQQHSTKTARQ